MFENLTNLILFVVLKIQINIYRYKTEITVISFVNNFFVLNFCINRSNLRRLIIEFNMLTEHFSNLIIKHTHSSIRHSISIHEKSSHILLRSKEAVKKNRFA